MYWKNSVPLSPIDGLGLLMLPDMMPCQVTNSIFLTELFNQTTGAEISLMSMLFGLQSYTSPSQTSKRRPISYPPPFLGLLHVLMLSWWYGKKTQPHFYGFTAISPQFEDTSDTRCIPLRPLLVLLDVTVPHLSPLSQMHTVSLQDNPTWPFLNHLHPQLPSGSTCLNPTYYCPYVYV